MLRRTVHAVVLDEGGVLLQGNQVRQSSHLVNLVKERLVPETLVDNHHTVLDFKVIDKAPNCRLVEDVACVCPCGNRLLASWVKSIQDADVL